MLRKKWEGLGFAVPLLVGSLIFYVYPFLQVIGYAFTKGIGANKKFVGLWQFQSLWENRIFKLAFGNSMKFLAVAIPLVLLFSLLIALILKNVAEKHGWLKSAVLLPYVMPVAGTVMLVEQLFAAAGLVNQGLYTLGLPVQDWLHTENAFWVAVLLYLWKNTGYSVILLLSGLWTIPGEHYDVASLYGASRLQQLRYVTLPQMWHSFFFAAVFSVINAFKCFREIFLIGGIHPHDSIYMLQHFMNNAFDNMNYPKLAVGSILLLMVLLAVFAPFYWFTTRKEAYKG